MTVSVLRAWRTGDPWRERIFSLTTQRWMELTGWEICTGDATHSDGFVSVSQGMNLARAHASHDMLVIASADHLPDPVAVKEAVEKAEQYGWAPIFRRTTVLTKKATNLLLSGHDIDPAQHGAESAPFCTSLMAVRADVWDDVGGWDERFYGWGCEDTAFRTVLRTLYPEPGMTPTATTYALWHPKSARDRFDSNLALLAEYQRWELQATGMREYLRRRDSLTGGLTAQG